MLQGGGSIRRLIRIYTQCGFGKRRPANFLSLRTQRNKHLGGKVPAISEITIRAVPEVRRLITRYYDL